MVSQRVFHSKKLSLWNSAYHLGQKIYYLTVHCLNLTSTLPAVTPSSKPKSFISSTVLLPSFTFKSLHPASSSPTPSLIPPLAQPLSGLQATQQGGVGQVSAVQRAAPGARGGSPGVKSRQGSDELGVSSPASTGARQNERRAGRVKWWWRGLVVEWIGVRCKSSQRQHATVEKGGWRVGDGERQAGRKRERERGRDGGFASLT